MNYDPTRHQHCLFNIPRGYYYCQLSTPWWFTNSFSSTWTVLKLDVEARWFSHSRVLFSVFCLFYLCPQRFYVWMYRKQMSLCWGNLIVTERRLSQRLQQRKDWQIIGISLCGTIYCWKWILLWWWINFQTSKRRISGTTPFTATVDGSERFKVVTNCDALRPTKDHRTTTMISSMTEQYLFHNQTQPLYINTTTSAYTEPNLTSTVYLTTLITSITLILFFTICLRIVIKLLIKKRRRQQGVMKSFQMISFILETSGESEGQVIFDATAL